MAAVKPKPDEYHTLTPYVTVDDAEKLIAFIEQAFGGTLLGRHDTPDGRVMHAEMRIGDSPMMISESSKQMPAMPGCVYVYVDDVDATYRKALGAGATSIMEPADMFWGDRFAAVNDPTGNQWCLAVHVEDVDKDELDRRAKAFAEQACG
jgi:PhnB protein